MLRRAVLGLALFCLALCSRPSAANEYDDDTTPGDAASRAAKYVLYQHNLQKPYLGANMRVNNWQFSGDAIVSKQLVRLTADLPSQAGQLWNTVPCYARHWVAELEFKVHGDAARLYGDGFVFWFTKEYAVPGNVFGNQDKFVGLAIFFDTYSNHQGEHNHGHPYVSAMLNDGTKQYDHDADGTHTELAGCQANFRNKQHPTRARISFVNNVLTVDLDYRGFNTWQLCFSEKGVHLPTAMHFGFSAITGALSDNHDIVSLEVKYVDPGQTEPAPNPIKGQGEEEDPTRIVPRTERVIEDRPHIDPVAPTKLGRYMGHIFSALMYLAIVVVIIAVVVYVVRLKVREKNMKRF